ncbi:MAG: DNA repair protein RadC [Flavipsychrobacter sp.]|nr:DNA repair protein RadC [Flavipsychrobacter sp.]
MDKVSNSIKNWSEDDRPREKMLQRTAAALTDAELLTILISSGTREKSALELAREILALAHNNLQELGRLSLAELQKVKGIGEARAITIAAAMELGRRRQLSEGLDRQTFTESKHSAQVVMPLLQDLTYEAMCVLYLNPANRMIRHEIISSGGLTATVADIRVILKNALLNNASSLIIAHNHPSGNKQPSQEDIRLTLKLKDSATLMDIKLLDHIIIAAGNYLSFADEGLL